MKEYWISKEDLEEHYDGVPTLEIKPDPDKIHNFDCLLMKSEVASMIEQFCLDLNQAHNELLMAQGCAARNVGDYDWPEWTPQANSIRAAEKLLGKRLAKTKLWSLFP